jgi:Tol biopolymer transport system component
LKQFLTIAIIFTVFHSKAQYYNGSNINFGQNRVQYNTFFWQSFDFERFKMHFTKGGKKHAIYAARSAHSYMGDLEKFLDYTIPEKVHFIIYNSQGKYRQSNIGLTNNLNSNIGGTANIDGNKIFIYYNGNHNSFNEQIKAGLSELIINKILYGNDWKQTIKNSSFTNLPFWFKEGLIDYMSKDWNTDRDNQLRDLILSGDAKKFNKISNDESRLLGHAMWMYIEEIYGKAMIPNLLYMTKVSKNIESGFIYVLGVSINMIQDDVFSYYSQRYIEEELNRISPVGEDVKIRSKKDHIYRSFKLNSNETYMAYVQHYMGQYKVKLLNTLKNRKKTILKGDYKLNRTPDFSHPNLAWHPESKVLAIMEEKKGEIVLNLYDTKTRKKNKIKLLDIEKVLSLSYNEKGNKLVLSAVKNGQTDIFTYSVLGNSQIQITNDVWDNLNPKFIPGTKLIMFSSNRTDLENKKPTFPIQENFDLFTTSLSGNLTALTNTPSINEIFPNPISKLSYHYLSDENGIYNQYLSTVDSTISYIDTAIHYRYIKVQHRQSDFNRNPLEFNFESKAKTATILRKENRKFEFYTCKESNNIMYENNVSSTHFRIESGIQKTSFVNKNQSNIDKNLINIYNYQFEKEKLKNKENSSHEKQKESLVKKHKLPLQEIYDVNFSIGEFVMQLNPTFNNQAYQRFSGGGFQNAGFDGFTMIEAKDVFEDYRITGGFKGPVQLNNTGYLVMYEDLKNRLDKKTLLSRQTFEERAVGDEIIKTTTYDLKHQISFPFSDVTSIRLTGNIRYDRGVFLSTSPSTLGKENANYYNGGGILEYVLDATRPLGLNILNGFRLKLWGEAYHELNRSNTDFFVVGIDVRNYQKIHRNIVFASRFAASTSFGSQRLVYYMGGVDGWLWPQFDPTIIPDPNQNFQFQTIATPIRGFFQNARNGNSFACLNNELRIPLFSYFSNKPLQSDFLENFMVIGFGDIGTAWTGKNPYSTENSFNTSIVNGHNYNITIQSQKEPLIYSYGFGIRSRIFGYYVRLDWGYGIDDHIAMPSLKQLSLSLDF